MGRERGAGRKDAWSCLELRWVKCEQGLAESGSRGCGLVLERLSDAYSVHGSLGSVHTGVADLTPLSPF